MVIGLCQIVLFLPDSGSLKNKRSILEGLRQRVRNKFNVSVSEIGDNELWQKARIGVAIVCNETRYANQVLSKVVEFIQADHRLELLDYSLEMM